jgi:hypothetical protein
VRVYWYHRATGKRLQNAPESAAGLLEVAALDKRAEALEAAARGSLGDLWASYIKSPEWLRLKPRTRSDYQAVYEWLGASVKVPVKQITLPAIIKLRDKAAKAKGRRFGNYVVQVLRMLLGWGRLRGLVETNAAEGAPAIRKPIGSAEVNRAWSNAEVAAFMSAAPFQLLVPFAMGLFAGMRQGDALMVTWRAYDGATLR